MWRLFRQKKFIKPRLHYHSNKNHTNVCEQIVQQSIKNFK
jgi:hypothetical protein